MQFFSFRPSPWSDPARKLRTLESFAETEADGGNDLHAAARRTLDAEVRGHLLRHAEDEQRHARLFREQAEALRSAKSLPARDAHESDLAYDLSRGRQGVDLDAHGFFTAGLFDELGDVAYIAMLHVAEQRAAEVFLRHRNAVEGDPELVRVFDEILKDEKYHVAYTGRLLDKWRKEGRGREVREGLRDARSSRFLGAWRRLGVRSAGGFGRVVLFVFYWTLLLPFGLAARLGRHRPRAHPAPGPISPELAAREPISELAAREFLGRQA